LNEVGKAHIYCKMWEWIKIMRNYVGADCCAYCSETFHAYSSQTWAYNNWKQNISMFIWATKIMLICFDIMINRVTLNSYSNSSSTYQVICFLYQTYHSMFICINAWHPMESILLAAYCRKCWGFAVQEQERQKDTPRKYLLPELSILYSANE
jgi:hypothetical protein